MPILVFQLASSGPIAIRLLMLEILPALPEFSYYPVLKDAAYLSGASVVLEYYRVYQQVCSSRPDANLPLFQFGRIGLSRRQYSLLPFQVSLGDLPGHNVLSVGENTENA
ncbi:predicted protein [Histoplasma capsulatum G186AR]|uniref:Uncharacterized protein n=1 Tax=Ajellomyces capsulatus (strain G186AR / H82 / ATCC MYA-2454 / RMSCC 2432) TaxID=447093 RepID=C0NMU5_AJECG|nr:uncharacterized protein HCBG_04072 [Histoplasma capsulatum G186AR]EEH07193.1 predicted protein [Histoplasma capsulatum G186AR]